MVNAIPIVEAVKELHKGYGLSKREKLRKVINMKEELLEFINSELDELRKKNQEYQIRLMMILALIVRTITTMGMMMEDIVFIWLSRQC